MFRLVIDPWPVNSQTFIIVPEIARLWFVCAYMDWNENRVAWGPIFRRVLLEPDEWILFALLEVLGQTYVVVGGQDRKWWAPAKDGDLFGDLLGYLK